MLPAPLLAAIGADPDADALRLVAADWYEEHGDAARAELIRVQVEAAALPPWERRAKLLRMRARVLLARHGPDFRRELPAVPGVAWGRFRRGFVDEVTVPDLLTLARAAGQLRDAAPVTGAVFTAGEFAPPGTDAVGVLSWLRRVRFEFTESSAEHLRRFLHAPAAEQVRNWDFSGHGMGSDEVAAFAALPHQEVDEANFYGYMVGERFAEQLAESLCGRGLRSFRVARLYGDEAADRVVQILAASPAPAKLRTLVLAQGTLTADSLRALFTAPAFAGLERVGLDHSDFGHPRWPAEPGPARWKSLDLSLTQAGPRVAHLLAAVPQLAELARLGLRDCNLDAHDAAALAAAPFAATLRELDLSDNGLDPKAILALAGGAWPRLHTLNVESNALGPDGAAHLAACVGMGPLLELEVASCELGDAGMKAIAAAPWAGELVRLAATNNDLFDGEAVAGLASLEVLRLRDNLLGSDGVAALAKLPALTDLTIDGAGGGGPGLVALAGSPLAGTLLSLDAGQNGDLFRAADALGLFGPQLRSLHLNRNPVGDALADALVRVAPPGLWALGLCECGITPAWVDAIIAQLGGRIPDLALWNNNFNQAGAEWLRAARSDPGPDWTDPVHDAGDD